MNATADAVRVSAYQVEVAKLRQQVEDLQFTVRDLRRTLKPARRFPPSWGLTRAQDAMLAALVDAAPNCASHERLRAAIGGSSCFDDVTSGNLRKVKFDLKAALSRLVPKAAIKSVNRSGYCISVEHAALIKAAVARECGSKP